jgi:hypothetical protein
MNEFFNLAQKYQCTIAFNHHTGKYTEERPPNKNNSIGSAGFEGKARLVMELRQDYQSNLKRHLCIVKGNYLGSEYKTRSFELDFDVKTGFTRTGNRKSFEELAKPKFNPSDTGNKDAQKLLVLKFHCEKKTISEIHEAMKELGHSMPRSTIGD